MPKTYVSDEAAPTIDQIVSKLIWSDKRFTGRSLPAGPYDRKLSGIEEAYTLAVEIELNPDKRSVLTKELDKIKKNLNRIAREVDPNVKIVDPFYDAPTGHSNRANLVFVVAFKKLTPVIRGEGISDTERHTTQLARYFSEIVTLVERNPKQLGRIFENPKTRVKYIMSDGFSEDAATVLSDYYEQYVEGNESLRVMATRAAVAVVKKTKR